MVEKELHDLIESIRVRGCEGQTIEVKAARQGCPERLYDTISAFSNQNSGGIFVFDRNLPRWMKMGLHLSLRRSHPLILRNALASKQPRDGCTGPISA